MSETVKQQIQNEIETTPVILFMKGDADFPQCGFSARVVQILEHLGVPFKSVNVLADAASVRALKTSQTGRPFRSFISRVSSSAGVTS